MKIFFGKSIPLVRGITIILLLAAIWAYRENAHFDKIDKLNAEIRGNLRRIDSLKNELIFSGKRQDSLLAVQKRINTKQRKIIGELADGNLSRRKKLRLLSGYLAFLDSVLTAPDTGKSESAIRNGR